VVIFLVENLCFPHSYPKERANRNWITKTTKEIELDSDEDVDGKADFEELEENAYKRKSVLKRLKYLQKELNSLIVTETLPNSLRSAVEAKVSDINKNNSNKKKLQQNELNNVKHPNLNSQKTLVSHESVKDNNHPSSNPPFLLLRERYKGNRDQSSFRRRR